jgi:hypothetical protein
VKVFTDEIVKRIAEENYDASPGDGFYLFGTLIMTFLGGLALVILPWAKDNIDLWLTSRFGYEAAHLSIVWVSLNLIDPAIQIGLLLLWAGIVIKFFCWILPEFARQEARNRKIPFKGDEHGKKDRPENT